MYKRKSLLFALLFLFLLLANFSFAQYKYESLYADLQDDFYYQQLDQQIEKKNLDSVLLLSNHAFNYFFEKGDAQRGTYLFLKGASELNLSPLHDTIMIEISEKLDQLRQKGDTNHIHFAALLCNQAHGLDIERKFEESYQINLQVEKLYELYQAPEPMMWNLYSSLGELEVELGDWWKGYHHLKKSLNGYESEEIPPHNRIALIYNTMAAILYQTNQKDLRMMLYQRASDLFLLDTTDYRTVGTVFRLSGEYHYVDDLERSLYYLNLSEHLVKHFQDVDENFLIQISILSARMSVYLEMNDIEAARKDHLEFEKRIREKVGTNHLLYSFAYESEAILYEQAQQYDSVISCYKKAMELRPGLPMLLSKTAETYHQKGNLDQAISFYRKNVFQALENDSAYSNNDRVFHFNDLIFTKTYEYRNSFGIDQLSGIFALPQVYLDAYKKGHRIDDLRKGLAYCALSDSVLTFFQSSVVEFENADVYARFYHQLTAVALKLLKSSYEEDPQQEYLDQMLYYMSQSTAFILNAEVNQMGYAIQESELKSSQIQITAEIRRIKNDLIAAQESQNKEMEDQLRDLLIHKSLDAFEIAYQLNTDTLRSQFEKYGSICHASEIQENLDCQEAIWLSNLSEDELFGLLITKDSLYYHTCDSINEDIALFYRSLKTGRSHWKDLGARLYQKIFNQWNEVINNMDHMIIVPDDDLGHLAFEALYDVHSEELFIEKSAISYHYSAWLWNLEEQNKKEFSEMSWCGFAPVFANENSHIDVYAYEDKNLEIFRDNGALTELEYSQKEIEYIAALMGKGHEVSAFLFEDANEEAFKTSVENFDIIHVATHGKVSTEDHSLSGLYFAESESHNITNDGFLYLGEMFNIPINANLLVLSACKSGAGIIQKGDAAQAFPRAFINNGVDNLLVSLWKIHDERSKDLMLDFYQNLESGMNYSKALQQAKLQQIKQGFLPKDWGAMILIGK
jgi:CHAT domain-containing protein